MLVVMFVVLRLKQTTVCVIIIIIIIIIVLRSYVYFCARMVFKIQAYFIISFEKLKRG